MGKIRCRIVQQHGQEVVEEIHKVVVHTFSVGDAEDPDIYAAGPMYTWEKSDAGQFIMKHAANEPTWQKSVDQLTWGFKYVIIAELEKKKLSEFYLRFGNPNIK
jgi:hypothetical protein